MARALLIDLDDTLYDERHYVLSGFRAVAGRISGRFPTVEPDRLVAEMIEELDTRGRGKIFDRVLDHVGAGADPQLVQTLVHAYRDHRPAIGLWPGVRETLADLARDHRLAVITDGLGLMQRRKVEALGIADLVGEVFYCWEHGAPKPDPACYIEALRRLDARPEDSVVIGDNPQHDMAAARAVGCRSIRVLTGRFAGGDDAGFPPDAVARSFTDVAKILRDEQFGAVA
ncbi:HAD family hydrolase [uncultured Phenylobacterium sp.]|uniref:HAD family hydrolase n=1 Tax=uncultured Phenylobacterium sp. TaxID=349273 RepID=UPI00260135BE|nr:HAD family hydrolase [uncultured Phenylobacterium sp.]